MAVQLRVYKVKEGQLDNWVELFKRGTSKLRREHGFEVRGWAAPETSEFVWIVERPGSVEEFLEADREYYKLPEHAPLHEEALRYLVEGQSRTWFLEPVELGG